MGKHDKTIEVSSEEFARNENKALRKKLAEKDPVPSKIYYTKEYKDDDGAVD